MILIKHEVESISSYMFAFVAVDIVTVRNFSVI